MSGDQKDLQEEVSHGDMLRSLVALRDYVAHELQGNRCHACEMSKLKTGDTASLVLRLQKILEDISALTPATKSAKGVVSLDEIRNRRRAASGVPESDNEGKSILGTQNAPRRQGGRQPRFKPGSGSN